MWNFDHVKKLYHWRKDSDELTESRREYFEFTIFYDITYFFEISFKIIWKWKPLICASLFGFHINLGWDYYWVDPYQVVE